MQAVSPNLGNPCYTPVLMPGGRPSRHERSAFGERLVSLRQQLGFSQMQVAEQVGVSQQAYAGWERSTTALRPEDILKLAEVFKVTTDELLGKEAKPQRGAGPTGKTRRVFEEVNSLPRHQQQKIVDTIETLLAGTRVKKAS